MFTGIIETLGVIKDIEIEGSNKTFWVESSLSSSFKIDESIAHDGVCLTVEEVKDNRHRVTAIAETLNKTSLKRWEIDNPANLERSLLLSDRLNGHFVQGHVDTTAICKKILSKEGSFELTFQYEQKFRSLIIEKGSVCINGISLTAFDVNSDSFKVAIIPYTWNNTNIQFLKVYDDVNIEFDLIGKYIQRKLSLDK